MAQQAVEMARCPDAEPSTQTYAIQYADGSLSLHGYGQPVFTLCAKNEDHLQTLLKSDAYTLATAFVEKQFDVEGDLIEAIRFYRSQQRPSWKGRFLSLLAGAAKMIGTASGSTEKHIQFHYSQSNEFYKLFLDPRMVYSCAYFRKADLTLEEAQLEKLNHICRKLDLQEGDRFLDIGCGWGALVLHAVLRYGAEGTGCTLSDAQLHLALSLAMEKAVTSKAYFAKRDYRSLSGEYDKIASVGMFEHVGHKNARQYFRTIATILAPGGLFLNHAIARPEQVEDTPETLFLQRRVFPGGELIRLSDVVRFAEAEGLEALDVENLRPHYARTCKAWVDGLRKTGSQAVQYVSENTYRTWMLYLASSSLSFEQGDTTIYQVLFAKREAKRLHMTREYIYSGRGSSATR
ncbi:MAG TPA: class I SAM-dependent methyltransferase [Bryobacteraceae bacterium]|jgi:cyclopropane-fatty-acyl-phospholipid synthase